MVCNRNTEKNEMGTKLNVQIESCWRNDSFVKNMGHESRGGRIFPVL